MDKFLKGDVVQHFKRQYLTEEELLAEPNKHLYEIIGVAMHTETGENMMVYQALYGSKRLFTRPYDMFMSKVDKEKYPDAKQEYRLELADVPANYGKVLEYSIGRWCAYMEDGKIHHAKIIKIGRCGKPDYLEGKKKNGDKTYIRFRDFVGFCDKPTKTNRNPKIYDFSLNKYFELMRINKEVEELAELYLNNGINNSDTYKRLCDLWLSKDGESRVPEYFEELIVPEVFKDAFDDIFVDFE